MVRLLHIPFLVFLVTGCIETQSSKGYRQETPKHYTIPTNNVAVDSNTVFSIFGHPLPAREMGQREKSARTNELKEAKANFERDPKSVENSIWLGRRTANLGLYFEAIKIYSIGLEQHPTSYRLLRHRGEAYIIIRQFDLAIEDLQRAAFYSRPAKNEKEEDAIPTNYDKPLGNDKFSIFYNLGIAYYMKGNYDKAISSFKTCLPFCKNDDLTVKLTDWFYLTYRKLGNEKAATELLLPINKKMKVLVYVDYLNRLLVYKGEYEAEKVLSYAENDDNSLTPILAYGIGNWYLFKGDVQEAIQIYERILLNKAWDSYEFIASEVDLKSLRAL